MEDRAVGHWAHDWLINSGVDPDITWSILLGIDIFLLILGSLVADIIARKIILRLVKSYVQKSKNTYDDVFLEKKVFQSLAHLIPAAIIWYALPWIFEDVDFSIVFLRKAITIYMIAQTMVVAMRFLKSMEYIGLREDKLEGKPISSYIQVSKIIVYIVGAILILSMVIGKSPITILTAFGAATAVILLIFRDTILGLVASIQISANDMVRLGDWVSMDKYGADGDVTEINLTTVKVRNWDKTITTVPTYAFISDSFKNWRGMQSLGIRRIKRSINIDISSIGFVTEDMQKRFEKFSRITDFVTSKQSEIEEFNKKMDIDSSELINGRRMTNVGVFRTYALHYLREHPQISQKETVMVRQLQSTELGLPLEIYAFSSDIAWVNYENIQSDIFDHLLAAAEMFELKIFQSPSGSDFRHLSSTPSE